MGSRADLLQRRFLFAPLLALALLGPVGDLSGSNGPVPSPGPTSTATPSPTDPKTIAAAALTDALETEQVYRVEHLVFAAAVGGELEELRALDPSVGWGTTVVVELPDEEGQDGLILVLRAPLPDGSSLCFSEVTTEQDAGYWYALAGPGTRCPKVRRGMRGWSADEATGWAG